MSLDIALLPIYIPSYYTTSHPITYRYLALHHITSRHLGGGAPLGFVQNSPSCCRHSTLRVPGCSHIHAGETDESRRGRWGFCRIGGCFWSVCGCVCVHWHVYVYIPIYTHTPSKIYYIYTVELFWLQNITVVKQSRNWMAKKNRPQTWKSTKAGFRWTCFWISVSQSWVCECHFNNQALKVLGHSRSSHRREVHMCHQHHDLFITHKWHLAPFQCPSIEPIAGSGMLLFRKLSGVKHLKIEFHTYQSPFQHMTTQTYAIPSKSTKKKGHPRWTFPCKKA